MDAAKDLPDRKAWREYVQSQAKRLTKEAFRNERQRQMLVPDKDKIEKSRARREAMRQARMEKEYSKGRAASV